MSTVTRVVGRPAALLVALAFAAALLSAQEVAEPEPRPGDTLGVHVVEPGETLSSITYRYLGVARLWRENHRLNPGVRDPNRLRIGQRLRVITHRELPESSAEILEVANRVEQQQSPADWEPAREGARLRRDDAVRTFRRSSTELGFEEDARLFVSELSLVYIRQVGERLTGVRERQIEIDYGVADLEAAPERADSSAIEVLVGDAIARPQPGPSGRVRSRLRTDEGSGDAAVMIYDGESAVEAGGQTVAVGRGMGTAVPSGQAPLPPERLLPAPTASSPANREILAISNPRFRWQPLDGAESYRVEVCRDRECGSVVDVASVTGTEWRPDPPLPAGDLFWRVRGVSASGLDGYPCRSLSMTRPAGVVADLLPPSIALRVVEPGRADGELRFYLGAAGAIDPVIEDDAAGVDSVRFRYDAGPWRPWRAGPMLPPQATGSHLLEIEASDRTGRVSEILEAEVVVLMEPPAPPTVRSPAPRARDAGAP